MFTNAEPILLIGPLSSPTEATGASLAFELLIDGFKTRNIPYVVVDITNGQHVKKSGTLSFARIEDSLATVGRVWIHLAECHTVYMTISSSPLGFFRDALVIWSSSLLSRRIVTHLHGGGYKDFYFSRSKLFKTLIRKTLSKTSKIIVLGELLREQFSFLPNFNELTTVVVNGLVKGLDEELLITKQLKPDEPIKLLYLSNLIPSKGFMDVLQACKFLKKAGVDFRCNLCGAFVDTITENQKSPTNEVDLVGYIDTLGLTDEVKYLGTVSGAKKQQVFEEAHLFLLPTYYPWEGQPISIIEAMAFSTPIISTKFKGIPEQLVDGYNGRFVEAQNPTQILDAISRYVENPDEYASASRNARKHFEKYFRREVHITRLVEVICKT